MPALNRVQLIGYSGKDPEAHVTLTCKNETNFSPAVDRRWRTAEGELKEVTEMA